MRTLCLVLLALALLAPSAAAEVTTRSGEECVEERSEDGNDIHESCKDHGVATIVVTDGEDEVAHAKAKRGSSSILPSVGTWDDSQHDRHYGGGASDPAPCEGDPDPSCQRYESWSSDEGRTAYGHTELAAEARVAGQEAEVYRARQHLAYEWDGRQESVRESSADGFWRDVNGTMSYSQDHRSSSGAAASTSAGRWRVEASRCADHYESEGRSTFHQEYDGNASTTTQTFEGTSEQTHRCRIGPSVEGDAASAAAGYEESWSESCTIEGSEPEETCTRSESHALFAEAAGERAEAPVPDLGL